VAAGRDPRRLPVQASDHVIVGNISDMWVDGAEQMVRYLEVTLNRGGKRLIPMPMAKIHADRVKVSSIPSELFASVPTTRSSTEVTLLEEDKISAFYGGGTLYAADRKKSRWDALR
jgi:photosynthetic reaction center H subunit